MQEGPAGVCGRVGRMQSLVPPLLHVRVDQEEQQVSAVPTGVVYSTDGQMNKRIRVYSAKKNNNNKNNSLRLRFVSLIRSLLLRM